MKLLRFVVFSLFIPLLLTAGCNVNEDINKSDIYFPAKRDPGGVQMMARTEGRLILDEGYLRLKPTFVKAI